MVEETKAEKKPTAKKAAPKTEKPAAPKAKASSSVCKSTVKSTQRKQGIKKFQYFPQISQIFRKLLVFN